MRIRVLLFLTAWLPLAAQVDDEREEALRLRGNWTVVSAERDGIRTDRINGDKLTFTTDAFSLNLKDRVVKGKHRLHPRTNPKGIDLTYREHDNQPRTLEGIYWLDGDFLKMCLGDPGSKERPSSFMTAPNDRSMIVVLRRDRKEARP
jgi:uncharacterized protein (TIGR03067 family)